MVNNVWEKTRYLPELYAQSQTYMRHAFLGVVMYAQNKTVSIGIHIITQSAPRIVCESNINKHEWHERNQFNYNAAEESKLKSCKCDCV